MFSFENIWIVKMWIFLVRGRLFVNLNDLLVLKGLCMNDELLEAITPKQAFCYVYDISVI